MSIINDVYYKKLDITALDDVQVAKLYEDIKREVELRRRRFSKIMGD